MFCSYNMLDWGIVIAMSSFLLGMILTTFFAALFYPKKSTPAQMTRTELTKFVKGLVDE